MLPVGARLFNPLEINSVKTFMKLSCIGLLVLCTACAHTGGNPPQADDDGKDHRLRNTLIAVGTVVVGAIIANEAESGARDAIRRSIND